MTYSTIDSNFLVLMTADCLSDIVVINRVLGKRIPGFREIWVNDGEELLDYLERVGKFTDPLSSPEPNLVLLADSQSATSGLRTLRIAARRGYPRRIPFIFLSENAAEDDERFAQQLGARFLLPQPIDKLRFDDQLSALKELRRRAA